MKSLLHLECPLMSHLFRTLSTLTFNLLCLLRVGWFWLQDDKGRDEEEGGHGTGPSTGGLRTGGANFGNRGGGACGGAADALTSTGSARGNVTAAGGPGGSRGVAAALGAKTRGAGSSGLGQTVVAPTSHFQACRRVNSLTCS